MNEIMHIVKPNVINVNWPPHDNKKCIPDKNNKDKVPLVSTLIQPSELEVQGKYPSLMPI